MKPNAKTQGDQGLDFDGARLMSVDRDSTRFRRNQWSGHSNDGRLVNYPGQKRVGNDGSCGHSGYTHSGKMPPTAATPSVPAQGSVRDNINRGSQHRGTPMAMPRSPSNPDRINAGAGPRKGNMQ